VATLKLNTQDFINFKNHYFTFSTRKNVISTFEITELSQALFFRTEETFLFSHLYGLFCAGL